MVANCWPPPLRPPTEAHLLERKRQRIANKEPRMYRRLARARGAIWRKWIFRSLGITLLMFAVPLLIWSVTWCWKLVLE